MLFASTALAARIERAAADSLREYAPASAACRGDPRGVVLSLGGGVAAYSGPGSPLNKVCGAGFAGPIDERELLAVEAAFAERACPVQVEVSTLADPSIGALLTKRGYVLESFEDVLGRALPAPEGAAPAEITVRPSAPDELAPWLDAVVEAFAHPDQSGVPSHEEFPRSVLAPVLEAMSAAPGFRRYTALRAGAFAGGASVHLAAGVAQMSGAATLPAHRRRGVQSALLDVRLAEATRAGCDLAVVTTQPGSRSQQNAQRRGFSLLYTRAVLVRR